jgi:hypothetical protein
VLHELIVLRRVSYVLECYGSEATGEGRQALAALLKLLRGDVNLLPECRDELLRRLTGAETAAGLPDRDNRVAMLYVSAATAYLWERVLLDSRFQKLTQD